MNFFEAQAKAKRATRWLVIVYVIATLLIVAGVTLIVAAAFYGAGDGLSPDPAVLIGIAVLTAAFILGSTLYKTALLSSGGGRVALDMGGTVVPPEVTDPLRRRLRNVVEEMSIASGVPVPEIYVLEEENGINAFAAGYAPADAAIAVTRGTLELLDRDELQGVIAHEFSHVLNGDMRLNIRMMGVLFGIMVLGIIGRMVLRGGYHSGLSSSRRNRGTPAVMAIGLGLSILGWIGVFFARLIKAAVSRQREFLADASAVQFTRQTDGIANALKKIGGYSGKSWFNAADPEEISHMLFAGGFAKMSSLFATHPPLTERIRALDPAFDPSQYPSIEMRGRKPYSGRDAVAGFAGSSPVSAAGRQLPMSADITETVGNPQPRHIAFARRLRASIPDILYDAAHSPELSLLLVVAMALEVDPDRAARQLRLVDEQMGDARTDIVRRFHRHLVDAGPQMRLPLLEIAFPMLKNRPLPQLEFLLDLVRKLAELDGMLSFTEYCFFRILSSQLRRSALPAARTGNRVTRAEARAAAIKLIRIVADQGNEDASARDKAFRAGIAFFGKWADGTLPGRSGAWTVAELDDCLDLLQRLNMAGRESLLQALTVAVSEDGQLTVAEAELLRAVCAALELPLPPILAAAGEIPGES
ncbi:MAG: M48 family metallopeptidase [Gammaproteobacteria bacterium]|nr:M48 family metallopeptidase [Gammaproteobacteria bacterium]